MKNKRDVAVDKSRPAMAGGPGIVETGLLALPLVALIPNLFVPPALSMMGLATQELGFAIYALILGTMALWESFRASRSGSSRFELERPLLLMMAALGLFITWQLVSQIWTPARFEGLRLTAIWLLFGFFLFAALTGMGKRIGQSMFHLLTLICVILALTILYERYLYGPNMLGFFFNHGITAEILVTLIPLQVASYFKSRVRVMTLVYFVVSLLAIVAVLIGMRRGALLGMTISLVLMGIVWGVRMVDLGSPRRGLVVAAMIIAGAGIIGTLYRAEVVDRYQGATQLTATEGGLMTRLRGWLSAIEMVKAHPIAGIGQAGYANLYGEYRKGWVNRPENSDVRAAAGPEDYDEIRSPLVHNEYFQTLVELGSIGLLLLLSFWLLVGRRLWVVMRATRSHWPTGAFFGLLAFGISSFTSGLSFRYTPGSMILALVIAIGLRMGATDQATSPEEASGTSTISLPGWLRPALIGGLVLIFATFSSRAYAVFQSQQTQGLATLNTEQLDFTYVPDNESGNDRLARRYQQVLRLDPHNSGAHLGYAILLFQLKRNAEALPHAEYAWRNGYSRPFGYVLTAFINEQLGNGSRAIEILEDCATAYPQSFFVRAALVDLLRKAGRIDEMRRHQEEMYREDRLTMTSWEHYTRSSRQKAGAEAKRLNLLPMSAIPENLGITLVAMRAHHYGSNQ